MNNSRFSKLKIPLIISLVVFLVVLVLGFLYKNRLQGTLLVSFQYVLWLGSVFIRNLDQRYLWLQILIASLAFAFGFSRLFKPPVENRHQALLEEGSQENGRIDFWQYRIYMYRTVRGGRIFSLLDFPKLIIDTLSFIERDEPETVKADILSEELQVPAEVYEVVATDEPSLDPVQESNIFQGGRNLIQRISGHSQTSELASDSKLEKVATYLENLLEDENDI